MLPDLTARVAPLCLQYRERYISLLAAKADTSSVSTSNRGSKSAAAKVRRLVRELSDDEDDSESDAATGLNASTGEPWLVDFNGYLNSPDQLGKHTIMQWWGVRHPFTFFCITFDGLCLY